MTGKRDLTVRVKTAKKRTTSSTRWLQRQLNDPYVTQAKKDGYRSRAAYKLLELDDKYKFLKPGKIVLDLGAAPGGWTQVAAVRTKSTQEKPLVFGIDLLPISPIPASHTFVLDFMADDAPDQLRALIPNGADVVLSDMAPNTTGHAATDYLRIMGLIEAAYPFATEVLRPNGTFIAKLFQGGAEKALLDMMRKDFTQVRHAKPKASRADSAEMYVIATGFRGKK